MESACFAAFLLLFFLQGLAGAANLAPLTLSWSPNPEKDVAGYEVSYGTVRGQYPIKIDTGRKTRTTVANLADNQTYYFVVRVYNRAGVLSAPSREFAYGNPPVQPPANRAPDGWITSPGPGSMMIAGASIDFTADATDPDGNAGLSYIWNFGAGSGVPNSSARNPGAVVFNTPGTYVITFTAVDPGGLADPSPSTTTITVVPAVKVAQRGEWKLKHASSEQPGGYTATKAFDGEAGTFWQSRKRVSGMPAHQIQVDLGSIHHVKGFQYLPRQDGNRSGDIGKYAFYVSMNGKDWGRAVASGSFKSSGAVKRAQSKPKHGRFIKLVSIGKPADSPLWSIAELNILESPLANRRPEAVSKSVTTTKGNDIAIRLRGSDSDGNPLSYQIISGPKHGSLSGKGSLLTYTPAKGFSGTDRITYRIWDGVSKSATATIRIRVKHKPASGNGGAESAPVAGKGEKNTRKTTGTVTIDGQKYLTLTIAKPDKPDGRSRRVEVSSNLVDWFSGSKHTTVMADNERFLKVRDNTPLVPGKKRHIRLKVTKG